MAIGSRVARPLLVLAFCLVAFAASGRADSTAQSLPFAQDWSNTGLITANDNWSGVPGIEGFRGDGLAAATGTDPQTILVADDSGVLDVNANQTNPSVFNTGGATEFDLVDDVVALTGSGTAQAPYLRLYLNTAGQSNVTVRYNLRDLDASTDNAVQQVALHYRVGSSGTWTNVASAYVADASSGPSLATLVTPICVVLPAAVDNQSVVQLRVMTTNAAGNDEFIGVDDLVINTAGCGVGVPNLSINDVAVTEGNAGTVTAQFTVSLSAPAGPGGVTFDIATQDNTATTADNDYVANALTGQTIPAGSSTYSFGVNVNGDLTPEANQTFFVNVTNVVGANVSDGQGTGTINNDDVTILPIHDVQGPGASSPIVGSSVTIRGIVTGIRSNGFFVQEEEADYDADPATSEGILVFTSAAPPAAAALGALVQVTGTVAEFVPTADPLQPPLTELTSPAVVQISTGNPLPAPIPLTTSFPDPAGVHDQLERLEGMRVAVASLTVSGPTLGSVNEPNATATSQGVFYGVVTGNPRPFREAGIQAPDPAPAGSIPPIPRFDSNPERIRVDSDGLVGGPLTDVKTGDVVLNLVGPLDYTFRTYSVLPDVGSFTVNDGGRVPIAVAASNGREMTIGSYNLERFFDTVNDPGIGEPVLTPAAFAARLGKASLGIRDFLRTPDILGIVECENLSTLQAVAARISADALAAAQPDPLYQAFLVEGNDVGGIDVGFLVKSAVVSGTTPRVEVVSVTQENAAELFVNPDASTELLNDRPPLVLEAIVHHSNGAAFAVTVIVVHQRSLNGVADLSPGSNGWATGGDRVRAKRQKQAESLANLIQARQIADPSERIVVLGDYNAFEVNDGLVDAMDVVGGSPVPDNQTAVPGDGVDLVNPDLDNLFDTPAPAERYSYVFDGNAQSLDHLLINTDLAADTVARRIEHPRINADFPETARNAGATVMRLADHDPLVGFFEIDGFSTADLSIAKGDGPDPVNAGANLAYAVTVDNGGPDPADSVAWSDTLPAGTTFVSLISAAGWSCTTPAVGAGGTVSCSIAALPVGNAAFTLTVQVDAGVAPGTVLSNTATATSTTGDPDTGDRTATATTTVASLASASLEKSAAPNPAVAGSDLTYTLTASNEGPSAAVAAQVSDPLPAGTTFVSLAAPAGWICSTPAVGSGGTVTCTNAAFGIGSAFFTIVVHVDPALAPPASLVNTATLSSSSGDPEPGDNVATTNTPIASLADLAVTKSAAPSPVAPGEALTYTITLSHAGPSTAQAVTLSDPLPAGTTFAALAAPAGWGCVTPAVGSGGTVTCSLAAMPAGSALFTLVVTVDAGALGSDLVNTATAATTSTDNDPSDNAASVTTPVRSPALVTATKSVTGSFLPGSQVTYTVVLANAGPEDQLDNPGNEFTDLLPAELALTGATASAGTAVADVPNATVTWNGVIPAGGSVTITIHALLAPDLADGTLVVNQGSFAYDADGNGSNEATGSTDDPATGAAGDPTEFVVSARSLVEIPTLDRVGLALLALTLVLLAGRRLRRRTG